MYVSWFEASAAGLTAVHGGDESGSSDSGGDVLIDRGGGAIEDSLPGEAKLESNGGALCGRVEGGVCMGMSEAFFVCCLTGVSGSGGGDIARGGTYGGGRFS